MCFSFVCFVDAGDRRAAVQKTCTRASRALTQACDVTH